MASIAISASLQRACFPHHFTRKQQPQIRTVHSLGTKQVTHVATINVEGHSIGEQQSSADKSESSVPIFMDERWRKGTWDLNLFIKNGKMDWDDLIVAEAKRRRFLELYPEASTNEEPVLFRSSIIPWWAWLKRSYLPEAELLNGRAAMVGFFAAYMVDALTGLDMVGQTGKLVCKAGLFVTVISILLLKKKGDFSKLKNLADEATLYDKQWQASWQDQNAGVSEKI